MLEPDVQRVVEVEFSLDDAIMIDAARGVWTVEKFVRAAAAKVAHDLVCSTSPDQRRGAYPGI